MTNNALFDYIIQNVNDGKYRDSTQWLQCKCPYCDATSNKRHFAIQLKPGEPIRYHCFRASCNTAGTLNRKVARDLGLTNPTFLKLIQNAYNEEVIINANHKHIVQGIDSVELGPIEYDVAEYFKSRTGYELTDVLQKRFRICCSAAKFLDNNRDSRLNLENVEILARKENLQHKRYIIFFNQKYTMLYARQINGDEKLKLSIIDKSNSKAEHIPYMFQGDGEFKFKDTPAENTLFLGEGIFDVINSYFHMYKGYSGVFMASTGFAHTKTLIDMYSKYTFKPSIVMISDSDIHINMYVYGILKRINLNRITDFYVVYNPEDHDFGDYKGIPFKPEVTKLHEGVR